MFRLLTIAGVAFATPALAHPGDHGGLDVMALAAHLVEPDHLIFATLGVIIGVLACRAGLRKGRQS